MFNKDFYPTPKHVIEMMGIDCYGKIVLEPSAGKGDIIKYLNSNGAENVLFCEINDELRAISSKYAKCIASDFLKVKSEDISHIDMIVMNPPFSTSNIHILHAWNIAPEGCEIISLCNYDSFDINKNGRGSTEIQKIIDNYGELISLGNVFANSERSTNVNIGLIRLFKPVLSDDKIDGFSFDLEEVDSANDGIVRFNEIQAVVNTYVSAVKCFDKFEDAVNEMYNATNVTFIGEENKEHRLTFGEKFSYKVGYNETVTTKKEFAAAFQKKCWEYIFNRIGISNIVTSGVRDDINKFINSRKNYPFTVKNIYRMLEIIYGTKSQIMDRAIVKAIDDLTRHTHENRYGVEGWKTNDGHLLNKKFIVPSLVDSRYGYITSSCQRTIDQIEDLIKAICFITGENADKHPTIRSINNIMYGEWVDFGFFELKVFKKGTGHFKFKDLKVWEMLNRRYAKIKGQVLPEKI